jgi:hypothetical protein
LDYIPNLKYLIEKDEQEIVLKEVEFLRNVLVEIQTKFSDKIQFGLFYLDVSKIKKELCTSGTLLIA